MPKKIKGFVLVEVAIALAVLGIIGAGLLGVFKTIATNRKIHVTSQRLDNLMVLLGGYVKVNGRLPCPSGLEASTRGNERPTCSMGSDFRGIIPYKTLGISESEARDGHGNYITFAVSSSLVLSPSEINASPDKTDAICAVRPSGGNVIVRDAGGQPHLATSGRDLMAFVLISHGVSGGGAFTESGTQIPTMDFDKVLNSGEGIEFMDKQTTKTFDDAVRWVTRDNLLALYAKAPCEN